METPSFDSLATCVRDLSRPVAARTSALFYLRSLGTPEAVTLLCEVLRNKAGTSLYRHEIAYVLGQMGDGAAVPTLIGVLNDETDDVVVRHECGEALGAIGGEPALKAVQAHVDHARPEISETCRLAVDLIHWREGEGASDSKAPSGDATDRNARDTSDIDANPYASVDPAPADATTKTVDELRSQLLDTSLPLFKRYRAMFSLRNRGTPECVAALTAGFADPSALLRHEVAYVLGQIQSPHAVAALLKVLRTDTEHGMVRHEAAEALGSIGGEEVMAVLREYEGDAAVIVKESCEVALDMATYWAPKPRDSSDTDAAADAVTAP